MAYWESLPRWHFDLTEQGANSLLALVLEGKKRATTSSFPCFEEAGDPLPRVGDRSVITDWAGHPRCVVETTAVRVLPFREMDFSLAVKEGEDDCLASWQRNHIAFFTAEGKALGYAFSEDMPVIFEEFRVLELL